TLPPPATDEYFVADVIGCQVINHDGARLGVIAETFWNGAHDVMIVRDGDGEAAERLIPMVPDFVREVDPAARTVRVEWQVEPEVESQVASQVASEDESHVESDDA